MNISHLLYKPSRMVGLAGMTVVLSWGSVAWLRLLANDIPPLELSGIALACAAVCSHVLPGTKRSFRTAMHGHPWYVWIIMAIGLTGGAAFYFAALARAPAAQVVVITYSWPLFFALASDAYQGRRPSLPTLLSLLLGLAGIITMQGLGTQPTASAWLGYAFGLMSGLCWVIYSLFLQVYPRNITTSYPAFFTMAAIVALILQSATGGLVWPASAAAWLAALVIGFGPYGLGFLAWGYFVQKGNPRVTPVLPFSVPVIAAVILVLAGQSRPTLSLFFGCLLVIAACVVAICLHDGHAGRLRRRPV